MRPRSGSLVKRGKIYWIRYQVNGKRVSESLGVSTLREAQQEFEKRMAPIRAADAAGALRAIKNRLEDAEAAAVVEHDKANPPLTVADAWDEFLQTDAVPAGAGTLGQYDGQWSQFKRWLSDLHPDVEFLRDVTPEIGAAYIRHLKERRLTGQRINQHLVFLRAFCRELAKPARMAVNPFDGIRRKKQLRNSKRMLTVEEVKLIIESADGELRTLLMLGAFLGLRLGDASTLLWSETDLARRIVARIPRKIAYKGEEGKVLIGIPSTLLAYLSALPRRGKYIVPKCAEQYERDVSLLTDRIQAHFEKCGIETVKPGTGAGTKRLDEKGKPIPGTGKRAVVLVGYHSLRHFYISTLAQAGAPVAVLQKLAGHASPAMTGHYTHITEQGALDAAAKMPALLGDGAAKPAREPLPAWAVEAVKTAKSLKALRAALLA
jgi:integrase